MRKIYAILISILIITPFYSFILLSTRHNISIELTKNDNLETKSNVITSLNRNPSIFNDMGLNQIIEDGYLGNNINVGIIDSGINDNYLYFDKIITNINYVSNEVDFDTLGHGTTVASLIAGLSFGNNCTGIAPEVNLHIFKAIDENGEVTTNTLLSIFDDIIDMKNDDNSSNDIDIVNLSLGANGIDAELNEGVINLWNNGIIVICAAGNEGLYVTDSNDVYYPIYYTVNSPGSALNVISVGALKSYNEVAKFSSIGPSLEMLLKPDLVAPGHNIVIMNCTGETIIGSGTSYATPVIVGGISCILSKLLDNGYTKPTPDEVKMALLDSCTSIDSDMYAEGNGIPNFEIMYDLLVSYQDPNNLDVVSVYPNSLTFPNKFDYDLETNAADVYYTFSEIEFSNFKTTLIVIKDLINPLQIQTNSNISKFLSVYCDKTIKSNGQYILNIDYNSRLSFIGNFEGNIDFVIFDGINEYICDSINVKITVTFWGCIRTWWSFWWNKIFILIMPIIFGLGVVVKKSKSKKSKSIQPEYNVYDETKLLKSCPQGYECIYDHETKSFKIIKQIDL